MAFEVFVGVEILAGGVDVGVAEEFLDGDDVTAALQEPRGVGGGICEAWRLSLLPFGRWFFESSEQMRLSSGLSRIF